MPRRPPKTDEWFRFGEGLTALRQHARLELDEAAALVNLTGGRLARWEASIGVPSYEMLVNYAGELGWDIDLNPNPDWFTLQNDDQTMVIENPYISDICGEIP